MLLEKIVSEGIAHNSYLIGSEGEAAAIDPRRDTGEYLAIAMAQGLRITHVFETHRNEDYAVGSCELARKCGAAIHHGAALQFAYGKPAHDGDRFTLGNLTITARETPGHTWESLSFVVTDSSNPNQPYLVFTGDLLFAGETGRTDFGGPAKARDWAAAMYDSLKTKIFPLGDGVIICPAHGAGSVCGETIRDLPLTTLGYERRTTRELSLDREAFIAKKTAEHHYTPPYFRRMEEGNRDGWAEERGSCRFIPVKAGELEKLRAENIQIVDIRSPTSYAAGHIPGSLSIWREGIPVFIGWFLDYDRPVILIDDFNTDPDSVRRHFVRLGYDNLDGYLAGGFPAWSKSAGETGSFPVVPVQEADRLIRKTSPFILDVRDRKNRETYGFIENSHHVYVGELPQHLDEIPRSRPVLVYCDAGYKGSLAASILRAHGITGVSNILGGFTAWLNSGLPVERGEG